MLAVSFPFCRVWRFGFWVWKFQFRLQGLGCKVLRLGFWLSNLDLTACGVWGLGFDVGLRFTACSTYCSLGLWVCGAAFGV